MISLQKNIKRKHRYFYYIQYYITNDTYSNVSVTIWSWHLLVPGYGLAFKHFLCKYGSKYISSLSQFCHWREDGKMMSLIWVRSTLDFNTLRQKSVFPSIVGIDLTVLIYQSLIKFDAQHSIDRLSCRCIKPSHHVSSTSTTNMTLRHKQNMNMNVSGPHHLLCIYSLVHVVFMNVTVTSGEL